LNEKWRMRVLNLRREIPYLLSFKVALLNGADDIDQKGLFVGTFGICNKNGIPCPSQHQP
jgi:hypothetical protein